MRRRCKIRDSSDEEEEEEEAKPRSSFYRSGRQSERLTRSRQPAPDREEEEEEEEEGDEPDGDGNHEEDELEDANNSALRRSSRLRVKPFRFKGQGNGDRADRAKRRRNSGGDENEVSAMFDLSLCVAHIQSNIGISGAISILFLVCLY
jgi:hypothetical protein